MQAAAAVSLRGRSLKKSWGNIFRIALREVGSQAPGVSAERRITSPCVRRGDEDCAPGKRKSEGRQDGLTASVSEEACGFRWHIY